jgi:hypothetical protein
MKLSATTRFPHPVLSPETDDFLDGTFSIDLAVEESLQATQVNLNYSVYLTEESLAKGVETGDLGVGVLATCPETYFSEIIPFGLAPNKVAFEPGTLIGRVTLQPVIWAKQDLKNFHFQKVHTEFGTRAWQFETGTMLALGREIVLNVGREKLAQIESIFSLVETPTLSDDTLSLFLDAEKIQILVATNLYQQLNQMRGMANGAPILLNSVYLPAVMQVLAALTEGASGYEGRRWHRVFMAKCDHLGITPDIDEVWSAAQRILASPFGGIKNCRYLWGG